MYIVREGERRGKGAYLAYVPVGVIVVGMWYYTRRQGRAYKFKSEAKAMEAAAKCEHITSYRAVRLTEKKRKSHGC